MSVTPCTRQHYWQQHIDCFQASGLSGRAYCAREALTYHCFIYWRRKLMSVEPDHATTPSTTAIHPPGFVTVQPVTDAMRMSNTGVELALPNGWVIGNIQSANVPVVGQLLKQLS